MFGMDLRSASTLKARILDELRRLGATRMEASYDGGNDEGGVNGVSVLRPVGKSDWMVYEVMQYTGQEPRRGGIFAGPFATKKEAQAASRVIDTGNRYGFVGFEFAKAEGEFVELMDADVGDWEESDKLYRLVDELLSHDFGTWAGDFSASGMVYADLNESRVWREGSISTYVDDPEAGEY